MYISNNYGKEGLNKSSAAYYYNKQFRAMAALTLTGS
jgi:hypothetical protein